MNGFYIVLTSLIATAVAIFAAQNTAPVELTLMSLKSVPLPVGFVVVMAASLGALSVMIIGLWLKQPTP